MSSTLRPVGPEPARTYWLRRLAIVGLGLAVLSAVIAVVLNAAGATAVSANPSPALPSVMAPATTGSRTGTSVPSALPSGSVTPSVTSASRLPTTARPAACEPSDIEVSVTGDQSLQLGEPASFALSLVNGGRQACVIAINAKNFEVRIQSGRERIWSTQDCAGAVPPITTTLGSERALDWQLTWDGRRSRAECKQDPEPLESGTYMVTALLNDAKPVRLRMVIRD